MNRLYNNLEDFLTSNPLTIDAQVNDGGGSQFPIKGIEIEAAILFCDISNFSGRTFNLTSTETLLFVNHFFTWITAESLKGRPGIVDKYIGDEVMVVYAREFGSEDPFLDAVRAGVRMIDYDPWSFRPHIGIAKGKVTVGYVGSPTKYNCSVFGQSVAMAARCAGVRPPERTVYGGYITFPANDWGSRDMTTAAPPRSYKLPDGTNYVDQSPWELTPPFNANFKNMGECQVQQLVKKTIWVPYEFSAESNAKEVLAALNPSGRYRP